MVFSKNMTKKKREREEEEGGETCVPEQVFSLLRDPISDDFSCPGEFAQNDNVLEWALALSHIRLIGLELTLGFGLTSCSNMVSFIVSHEISNWPSSES